MTATVNASTSAGVIVTSDTSGALALQTAGTTAVTINTSQQVGIGTSTIYANVQIAGASNATVLKVSSTDQASGMLSLGDGGSTTNNVGVYRGQPHALSNGNWLNLGGYDGIAFTTGNNALGSQTEVMRIDTSGNLGLGVTPSAWSTGGGKAIQFSAGGINSYSTTNMQLVQNAYFNGGSWIYLTSSYATTYNQSAGQHSWYVAPSGTAGNAVSLSQAMTIDNSGNLGLNTTAQYNNSRFNILTSSGQNGIGLSTPALSNDAASFYTSTSTFAGRITPSGSSTSYQTSSDYRLKENIQPMIGALDKVKALKPITFDWIADKKASQGFIAHELQEIVPDCVNGSKDEVDADGNPRYQGIDTSFLVATLTAAIQELSAELNALKLKVGG